MTLEIIQGAGLLDLVIPQEQWWIVDTVLDLRNALEQLPTQQRLAIELTANGVILTPSQRQNLLRARKNLREALAA